MWHGPTSYFFSHSKQLNSPVLQAISFLCFARIPDFFFVGCQVQSGRTFLLNFFFCYSKYSRCKLRNVADEQKSKGLLGFLSTFHYPKNWKMVSACAYLIFADFINFSPLDFFFLSHHWFQSAKFEFSSFSRNRLITGTIAYRSCRRVSLFFFTFFF